MGLGLEIGLLRRENRRLRAVLGRVIDSEVGGLDGGCEGAGRILATFGELGLEGMRGYQGVVVVVAVVWLLK